ncbi:MAG: hypothetical protein ABJ084_14945 [Halioglobus sp.]
MPTHKSTFEVKDPTPPAFGSEECHVDKYMGMERRSDNRRTAIDRRGDVRFDLKAEDRRQVPGRRDGDKTAARWI